MRGRSSSSSSSSFFFSSAAVPLNRLPRRPPASRSGGAGPAPLLKARRAGGGGLGKAGREEAARPGRAGLRGAGLWGPWWCWQEAGRGVSVWASDLAGVPARSGRAEVPGEVMELRGRSCRRARLVRARRA